RQPAPRKQAAFTRVLTAHGYILTSKPVKKIVNKTTGEIIIKGNLDVELAVDALVGEMAYDTFILFSGDSDFLPLLRALKEKGKEVAVYSTEGISAWELLIEPGIDFHDLAELRERVGHARTGEGSQRETGEQVLQQGCTALRLPVVGEVFTGTVLSVKSYGVFLTNTYHAKCLLPLSFLGITKHITDLTSVIRMADVFDVVVFKVDSSREVPEITVKLADKEKSHELSARIA
ncbi:MAG: NYN domain-containing protein, partial [Chlorobiaceae bacterium]|nr:NYN domain-containing protein [Chlorobiaceae bacterium]